MHLDILNYMYISTTELFIVQMRLNDETTFIRCTHHCRCYVNGAWLKRGCLRHQRATECLCDVTVAVNDVQRRLRCVEVSRGNDVSVTVGGFESVLNDEVVH